ncbi:sigma factor-like helix-turn-helix DNA-binding protein [Sphingomonas qilianensis]|uniref:Helix-turn-helix transcriptional regulator n=1 Tax=Sphingomonas qilianensis TaxID=1736690 RepID=A0ABU9XTB3_9SPHN
MTDAQFDRVTELQRECLRLVLTRHNSKEIAQVLGISPVTVDKRIGRAVSTLGVATRFEAARLLAAHESGTYQPLVYQPPDIVPGAKPAMITGSEALTAADGGAPADTGWLPLRPKGGRYNTLTIWQRLLWIVTIPAALAVAVGMLGFGLSVVGKVLRLIGAVVP